MEIKTIKGAIYDRCGNAITFSRATNIHISRGYRLIEGKMKPRIDEIARIADCLDMTIPQVVYLFTLDTNQMNDIREVR